MVLDYSVKVSTQESDLTCRCVSPLQEKLSAYITQGGLVWHTFLPFFMMMFTQDKPRANTLSTRLQNKRHRLYEYLVTIPTKLIHYKMVMIGEASTWEPGLYCSGKKLLEWDFHLTNGSLQCARNGGSELW